jgi:hypothetical protein
MEAGESFLLCIVLVTWALLGALNNLRFKWTKTTKSPALYAVRPTTSLSSFQPALLFR